MRSFNFITFRIHFHFVKRALSVDSFIVELSNRLCCRIVESLNRGTDSYMKVSIRRSEGLNGSPIYRFDNETVVKLSNGRTVSIVELSNRTFCRTVGLAAARELGSTIKRFKRFDFLRRSYDSTNYTIRRLNRQCFPVPRTGFLQSCTQGVLGLVAEYHTAFINRGLGMGHIPRPGRPILEFDVLDLRIVFGKSSF